MNIYNINNTQITTDHYYSWGKNKNILDIFDIPNEIFVAIDAALENNFEVYFYFTETYNKEYSCCLNQLVLCFWSPLAKHIKILENFTTNQKFDKRGVRIEQPIKYYFDGTHRVSTKFYIDDILSLKKE